jgi:uncharacterized membrane protein YidH (DUF202 family)
MNEQNELKIRRISGIISVFSKVAKVFITIAALISILVIMFVRVENMHIDMGNLRIPFENLDSFSRVLIVILIVIGSLVLFRGFHHLDRLFSLFKKGEIFTKESIARLKKLGLVMICWSFVNLLYHICFIVIVSKAGFLGGIDIKVNLSGGFIYLLWGLVVFAISWVFEEGYKLREDNELVI